LFEHFLRRLRARLVHGKSVSPWELLERQAGIPSADLRQLKDWYADACASRNVPLQRLHNLIVKIDRHLTA
jgi:hypothetical protein